MLAENANPALAAVVPSLRCPICAGPLALRGPALRCDNGGHTFDIARQGYANLLPGRRPPGGDTPAMVAARSEVLAAGHLDVVTSALGDAARDL